MSEGFKGQCLCGAVSYESAAPPLMLMKCHCRDCQYISGGEASAIISLPKEGFKISGEVKTYSVSGQSGKQVHRRFCPKCGTHIYSEADIVSDPIIFVKAGTMDKQAVKELKTGMEMWIDNANPFSHIDESAPSSGGNPGS